MDLRERLFNKKTAYQRLFLQADGTLKPDAFRVLADLKRFCYVNQSTIKISPITRMTDTHATMLAEGRRETWNRIQGFLYLQDRVIIDLEEEP